MIEAYLPGTGTLTVPEDDYEYIKLLLLDTDRSWSSTLGVIRDLSSQYGAAKATCLVLNANRDLNRG